VTPTIQYNYLWPNLDANIGPVFEHWVMQGVSICSPLNPAHLVSPSGRLDAPLLNDLHWPASSSERIDITNQLLRHVGRKQGGFEDSLMIDIVPTNWAIYKSICGPSLLQKYSMR
jgi:hypothetical protein